MLNIKKYANGQFFDTINKKYIKVAKLKELIQKGEKKERKNQKNSFSQY